MFLAIIRAMNRQPGTGKLVVVRKEILPFRGDCGLRVLLVATTMTLLR